MGVSCSLRSIRRALRRPLFPYFSNRWAHQPAAPALAPVPIGSVPCFRQHEPRAPRPAVCGSHRHPARAPSSPPRGGVGGLAHGFFGNPKINPENFVPIHPKSSSAHAPPLSSAGIPIATHYPPSPLPRGPCFPSSCTWAPPTSRSWTPPGSSASSWRPSPSSPSSGCSKGPGPRARPIGWQLYRRGRGGVTRISARHPVRILEGGGWSSSQLPRKPLLRLSTA